MPTHPAMPACAAASCLALTMVLGACSTRPAADSQAASAPRTPQAAPAESAPLQTAVVPLDAAPKVGQAVVVRLDAINATSQDLAYDSQQAGVNQSFLVIGPDGKPVPSIGMSFQTSGAAQTQLAGERRPILASVDLTEQYLMDRPGVYRVSFVGRGGLAASPPVSITLAAGEPTQREQLLRRMVDTAPAGWRVMNHDRSYILMSNQYTSKADVRSVVLTFTTEQQASGKGAQYMGRTTLGHAWLTGCEELPTGTWPDCISWWGEALRPFQFHW